MRKTFLGMLGAVVASMSVPANAADLPARVYPKAPAVVPSPIYDWSGFYIGINGGGALPTNAGISWQMLLPICRGRKVVMTRPAAPSVVKSVTAGNRPIGCSVSRVRATGRISAAAM